MITRAEAYQKAKSYILADIRDHDVVVPEEWVVDHGWCWTFGYNTRAAYEGDHRESLVGGGPVVVVKETGAMYETGSAHPVEHFLQKIRWGHGIQVLDLPRPYRGSIFTREEAYEKAKSYILAQPSTVEIVVPEEWVDNRGSSWLVYHNSRAFYESGDMRQMLPGTPPVEVVKETAAMYLLGSSAPEVYFREWVRLGRKPPEEFWWSRH
jgi:hypothetical protein